MFEQLTQSFTTIIKNLTGKGRLTESNISLALKEMRNALLEADVAVDVVKKFIQSVSEHAIGQEVLGALKPGETLTRVVHDELVKTLGSEPVSDPIPLKTNPPGVILIAGLQGAGKTTTAAKISKLLKDERNKNVLLTSVDIQRPAAIDQLETLSKKAEVDFYRHQGKQAYSTIIAGALKIAKANHYDALIIDTAGRLHVDDDLMNEIKEINQLAKPEEILFVADSMMGQDAASVAKSFNEALPITGTVLTKMDADSRGGAALSICEVTGKPIIFTCEGEHLHQIDEFSPTRIASQILGMGDVVSLVKHVERQVDEKRSKKTKEKLKQGRFDLEAFQNQLEEIVKIKNIDSVMSKIPGVSTMSDDMKSQLNQQLDIKQFKHMLATIQSMTTKEKNFPDLIKGSRKKRIALGSGTDIQLVNKMLKKYKQMQRMTKKLRPGSKSSLANRLKRQNIDDMLSGG
ncbi:MAG: signal recognition particle protein [Legionellales bacterium]|nr:signal recognition particle protein [Legionellales bacterium]OUX67335.1 MAG: signal recognition particle protein [bacterium TMED178]|tara:strand:- start:6553 stop:7932 length:1380 start_codon:yes stop_codon:yes gene_type:complete